MIDFLKATFQRLIAELNITTYRYLYQQFHIKNRLTGIVGPRGTGKTTLMLQYIKNNLYNGGKTFYFSADNIYFNSNTLLEFVTDLYRNEDINIFFIDEIHKYSSWRQELKNIYDAFPKIKIVFSGSSVIDLVKGSYDLSRRAKLFRLSGLSLREYINFTTGLEIPAVPFIELKKDYHKYDQLFSQIPKITGHFHNYLNHGYYPFVFEDETSYHEKVLRIIEKTIYEDISNYHALKTTNLGNFKLILNFLATSTPGNISINNLAQNLSIDHKTAANYLHILNEAGLIRLIFAAGTGSKCIRKPEKAFLHNTTLLHTLLNNRILENTIGTIRELFFAQNIADAGSNIFYSSIGDFQVNDLIFEIGGKNKTKQQIKNVINTEAFLVKDNILVSGHNIIPLYYFGFIY